MYRVAVVDDENIERKGICLLLGQMDAEFEILEFPNGQAAWDWLQTKQADILLTDIKMPFMDGMELIRRVSELGRPMRTVIFSGFDEFEYAKTAMRYHVDDYILKPVDPEEFAQTMGRVVRELDARRREDRRREENQSFLLEHILFSLVNGVGPSQLKEKFGGEELFGRVRACKRLLLIETGRDFFDRDGQGFGDALAAGLAQGHFYVNLNPRQSVLFFLAANQDWESVQRTVERCVRQAAGDVRVDLAVSEPIASPEEIGRCFEGAELLMEGRFYRQTGGLFLPVSEEKEYGVGQEADDTIVKQIRQAIRIQDVVSLRKHYKRLCERYRVRGQFSQIYVKFIFSTLLKDCCDALGDRTEEELNGRIEELYRAGSFSEVERIAGQGIDLLEERFGAVQGVHPEIQSVKSFICRNYGQELGIEALAEQVHMAPAYLSALFKKETGQNLSKYIRAVRMEKAKELLEGTYRRIGEIGAAVGYANVSYFCQSFREYYGVSPQRFRDKGEAYEEAVEENQRS